MGNFLAVVSRLISWGFWPLLWGMDLLLCSCSWNLSLSYNESCFSSIMSIIFHKSVLLLLSPAFLLCRTHTPAPHQVMSSSKAAPPEGAFEMLRQDLSAPAMPSSCKKGWYLEVSEHSLDVAILSDSSTKLIFLMWLIWKRKSNETSWDASLTWRDLLLSHKSLL